MVEITVAQRTSCQMYKVLDKVLENTVEKVIRDGKVAVVYSPGFGAGWYTWNQDYPEMIYDPTVVHYVEQGCRDELLAYCKLKWPDAYTSCANSLEIEWLPVGTAFRIHEYEGNESIETKEELDWLIA